MVELIAGIVLALIAGISGYLIGSAHVFRDQKQRAYTEIVPPIIKVAYDRNLSDEDEKEFNRALLLLWIYASRDVALKWEEVLKIIHGHDIGKKITVAIQEAIVSMRDDIQLSPRQKIFPREVNHFYTHIIR